MATKHGSLSINSENIFPIIKKWLYSDHDIFYRESGNELEKITKKKLDPKYEAYLHGAGMVLLLALTVLIMFKDIFTIFKG